jgi:enamine deaminase RidA (YjgF/YER057c/UK114 family)
MYVERRLESLGIELPSVPAAAGNFVDAVRAGDLLFTSGKGPRSPDGRPLPGKVGHTVTTEEAYQHARSVGLILIAVWKETLGELDRIERIVKVLGLVNAVPDFSEHPKVINGCSDLFVEVFGDRGRHARSAIGAGSLPSGIPVEIEAIVQVKD